MSRNAGQRFLQGFQPNFANMFDMGFKTDQIVKERQRQEQEKLKYQQEQAGILNQLVASGKRGKIDSLSMGTIPFSPQEQTGLISQADDNTLQRYKLISEMNKPKEKKPHTYLNFDKPEGIYGLNPETDKYELVQPFNPLYKAPEEEPIWKGEGYIGNKRISRKKFRNADGTERIEDIDTGFYKETSGSGQNTKSVEKLNLDNYKKSLSLYEAKYGSMLTKVGSYQKLAGNNDLTASGKKEEINKDLDVLEQEFAMIVAPEVQGEIDKFYNSIKQRTGGEIPEGYEYQNREGLKQAFLNDVVNKYKKKVLDPDDLSYIDGYDQMDEKQKQELHEEMNALNFRALKNWANLKFKRL